MDMDISLSCRVCLGEFNDGTHRPLLLPTCGHSFCTFCIDHLYKQAKYGCPECKKANAVKDVSSLPVNYSLLSVAKARQQISPDVMQNSSVSVGAMPSASEPRCQPPKTLRKSQSTSTLAPQSAPGVSKLTSSMTSRYLRANQARPHHELSRVNQAKPFHELSHANQAKPRHELSHSRRSGQFMGRSSGANVSSVVSSKDHEMMTLQEELDFQMAIHLTFCKDASHGHDDATRSLCRWQYPEDDELHTALALSREYKS
nr:uncharacterized protein LOC123756693 isoform X2 [Procambarus clarkii]